MKRLTAIAIALLLAACGSDGPLVWPEGGPPPAPIGAEAKPTAEDMLEPPPQAAPVRVDDPVRNTDERREDRFDLPPT